jgi:hypothetical protein
MPIDHDCDLDERVRRLELRLDRALDVLARVADDLDQVAALRESLETGVADVRADLQRGFADLRNAVRHFGVRIGEADRYRSR